MATYTVYRSSLAAKQLKLLMQALQKPWVRVDLQYQVPQRSAVLCVDSRVSLPAEIAVISSSTDNLVLCGEKLPRSIVLPNLKALVVGGLEGDAILQFATVLNAISGSEPLQLGIFFRWGMYAKGKSSCPEFLAACRKALHCVAGVHVSFEYWSDGVLSGLFCSLPCTDVWAMFVRAVEICELENIDLLAMHQHDAAKVTVLLACRASGGARQRVLVL